MNTTDKSLFLQDKAAPVLRTSVKVRNAFNVISIKKIIEEKKLTPLTNFHESLRACELN